MTFTYADLFAGVGGFHAAMAQVGGTCVFASELDRAAAAVYEVNWGTDVQAAQGRPVVEGDIVPLTEPRVMPWVPDLDVVCAGFPCQPFSKSGHQRGINETRGTLFFNILRLLQARKPSVILLENVRNLAGPRHQETWSTIVRSLRDVGYRVSARPTVLSPHQLPPHMGGTPQVRHRVFITGTYVGPDRAHEAWAVAPTVPLGAVVGWDPQSWDLERHLPLDRPTSTTPLSETETGWIDAWDRLVQLLLKARNGKPLPGFPLWADAFKARPTIPTGTPAWKRAFLLKNSQFYVEHQAVIDQWRTEHPEVATFPPSRRKLEWQAQDAGSLWDCLLHLRPSGIRAKKPTYVPALVAITQTSILGPKRRRLTVGEGARLQGLPKDFDFGTQPESASFKQLGNGVAVGAALHVFRTHVLNDRDVPQHVRDGILASLPRPVPESLTA